MRARRQVHHQQRQLQQQQQPADCSKAAAVGRVAAMFIYDILRSVVDHKQQRGQLL